MNNAARFSIAGLLLAPFAIGGCGAAPDAMDPDPAIDTVSEAVTTWSPTVTDGSGKISVRIKTCDYSALSNTPTASCSVDTGWVLVGGGADISGNLSEQYGVALTGSWPDSKTTWKVSSASDGWTVTASKHKIRAHAIEMKLAGVSSNTLLTYMKYVNATTTGTSNGDIYAFANLDPNDYYGIGGGVRVSGTGGPYFVTANSQQNGGDGIATGWFGRAQVRLAGAPVAPSIKLTSYVIGITKVLIPNFGHVYSSSGNWPVWESSFYFSSSTPAQQGFVMTTVGGQAWTSYADGSYGPAQLTGDYPYYNGSGISSASTARAMPDSTAGGGMVGQFLSLMFWY
jgi:hypothetical protein